MPAARHTLDEVSAAIQRHGGSVPDAARQLGITSPTLYARIGRNADLKQLVRTLRPEGRRKKPVSPESKASAVERDVQALWRFYLDSGRAPGEAEDLLVRHYRGMAVSVANAIGKKLPKGIDFHTLEGAALVGLLHSIRRFDLSRGLKFATFAVPCIRGRIFDDLRNADFVPRLARRTIKAREAGETAFFAAHGRLPTADELCQWLGWEPSTLNAAAAPAFSPLEKVYNETESGREFNLRQVVPCREGRPDREQAEEEKFLRHTAGLDFRERSRVSQMHSTACERLRKAAATPARRPA